METRLKGNDTTMDVIMKMSEGNPGCVAFLMDLLEKSKDGGFMGGMGHILALDTLSVYGSKAYILWNDCCNRDIAQVELVLRNWQMGKLSSDKIHENLDNGRGVPFEGLISMEELFA